MPGTVTVASKLPFAFIAEFGGKKVTFEGSPHHAEFGMADAYGLTPGVDADWFSGWKKQAADFDALTNGVIFAADDAKAGDEAKEKKSNVKSGMEQKTAEELGVEVVAKED